MSKDLVVGIFVDFMGAMDMSMKDEMDYIQTMFKENFPDIKFLFKRELPPGGLEQTPVDLYVFDWGGVMPGCDDTTHSMYRSLVKQIEEKPNTLFVIWSSFSKRYYEDELAEAFPKEKDKKFHNVLFSGGSDERGESWKAIRLWIEEGEGADTNG